MLLRAFIWPNMGLSYLCLSRGSFAYLGPIDLMNCHFSLSFNLATMCTKDFATYALVWATLHP